MYCCETLNSNTDCLYTSDPLSLEHHKHDVYFQDLMHNEDKDLLLEQNLEKLKLVMQEIVSMP